MITLTENAAGKVKELLEEEGRADIALRVAVQPGGCSGLRYAMYLDDQVTDKDATEEQFGVRLVIDKMSVPYLSQATIDFVDSLEQSGLHDRQPCRPEQLRLRQLVPLGSAGAQAGSYSRYSGNHIAASTAPGISSSVSARPVPRSRATLTTSIAIARDTVRRSCGDG